MAISNIKSFLKKGTLLSDVKSNVTDFVINNCDDFFGDDFVMYYFYKKGYKISFIYSNEDKKIKVEQVEISNDKTDDNYLNEILTFKNFTNYLSTDIEEIYFDDDEDVIFMKNGLNIYFNNKSLSKITSQDIISRNFVINYMQKSK